MDDMEKILLKRGIIRHFDEKSLENSRVFLK